MLGGSSSINGMFFMRGHSADFDGWQELGCEGWSYAHVLPYFKKLECSWRGAVPYHGTTGPMPVAANATTLLLFYIYQVAFSFWDTAYAAALSTVLLAVLASIAFLQFFLLDRKIHYR